MDRHNRSNASARFGLYRSTSHIITVLRKWASSSRKSDNFQLHPPVSKDSNLATNNSGNLDLPLMFRADELEKGEVIISFFQDELPPCVLYERTSLTVEDKK